MVDKRLRTCINLFNSCNNVEEYVRGIVEILLCFEKMENIDAFLDDKEKNIETANKIGMLGKNVEPDNYESIENLLKSLKIYVD